MEKILNITNGDSAVVVMKAANLPGFFLPWRDVLHDGPVPEGLPLEELSKVRAQFISEQGWGDLEEVKKDFVERDEKLKSFEDYERVILWFEHDLYDQLQILQILDWFSRQIATKTKLSIICTDQYLGVISPEETKALLKYEEIITEKHLQLAQKAWTAFRSPTPEKWQDLLQIDTSLFPFLKASIIRLLEEYPNRKNGLSRTAQKALKIIWTGEKYPVEIFARYQETEESRFLGDSSFWVILDEMLTLKSPLLILSKGKKIFLPFKNNQELRITPLGKEVLEEKKDWLNCIELDRWLGGVHLTSINNWRWDSDAGILSKNDR